MSRDGTGCAAPTGVPATVKEPVGVYAGRSLAPLTQHGKERAIAPVLEPALGCRVRHVTGYDTDRLGTFTRDIPRAGTQLEAARRKARIGMERSGLPLGLASEGSFGADPMAGLFPRNVELLMFLDEELGLEIVGRAHGAAKHVHRLTGDWVAAEAFALEAGFPEHQLVVRPEGENDPRLNKGIADRAALAAALGQARRQSANGQVFLESDLRAHANPTPMVVICRAAEDPVARLRSLCPACGLPGFALVEHVAGLPCSDCGAPTRETRADVPGCVKCAHREQRPRAATAADPGRCGYCNP
jgi:ribosomal protein S27AE